MSEREFDLYLELLGKFLRLRPGQTAEIADELRDHLEARLEELSRAGLSRADAVRRALGEFGDAACLADHFSQLARERKRRFIMRCSLATVSVAAVALMFGSALWPHKPGMQAGPSSSIAATPQKKEPADDPDARVDEILNTKTMQMQFEETPLRDVVEWFTHELSIDIVPSNDARVQYESPITLNIQNTKLTGRAALQLVLEQVNLSYTIRDGIIVLRLPEQSLAIEMLSVGGLLGEGEPKPVDQLLDTIRRMVRPNDWEETGGLGSLTIYNDLLIVRNTPEIIGEVHRFVTLLQEHNGK